eukprot:g4726.t1
MDREISTYEEELIDKTAQMAAISRSKEDLAIALLDEKKRANMLNSAVLTAKKNMKEQTNEIAITKLENDGLKQSLEIARKNEDEFRSKFKSADIEIQKLKSDLQQMRSMTMAYDSDVKVRAAVEQNLERDIERVKGDNQKLNTDISRLRQQLALSDSTNSSKSSEILELKAKLKSKDGELAELSKDYEYVANSKNELLRQWESAVRTIEKKEYALTNTSKEQEKTQGESGYRKELELMKTKYEKVCQELQVSNKKTRDITIAWINAQQKCLTQDTDSVTAALDAMRVDYSYKPDIEVSERMREALAQPLILSADEIIDSEDLNEESLSRAIQGKGSTGPESSPDSRDNLNTNTFNLRATRNNMLMAIGPKPTAKASLANFPKRKGRVYKEIGGSS